LLAAAGVVNSGTIRRRGLVHLLPYPAVFLRTALRTLAKLPPRSIPRIESLSLCCIGASASVCVPSTIGSCFLTQARVKEPGDGVLDRGRAATRHLPSSCAPSHMRLKLRRRSHRVRTIHAISGTTSSASSPGNTSCAAKIMMDNGCLGFYLAIWNSSMSLLLKSHP
jgi:hypothetical protein